MTTFYYFSAKWCGPCKAMKPLVEKLATQLGVVIQYVDCEVDEQLTTTCNVRAVPTLLKHIDGKEADRLVGKQTMEAIEKFLTV